ncbi:uncharacterized protein LOC109537474 isoform X1 [Dendroctonus ponderosae]|uniref:Uncharacterized protein n=1 Tax=Dendroctonus ponderosae TaxID=77166 RepID=U4UK96_DENPD|nr:uncharacterized protein LOC109537474 isoform X1 [Dendroctonus ponderosae]ERL93542.1 hypothetical protein D910_10831 [Dendroctonus ponderosae]
MVQFAEPEPPKPSERPKARQQGLDQLGKRIVRWWEKESIQYAFNIPQVRTRIEKLMGINYVSLTDRNYMQKLQERILEDYEEQMQKRIKVRQEEEMERVKNLVLAGKIPLDQAPPEMAQHPIMLIENYCNQKIAERRAKIKIYRVKIPTYLYWDDTPDPPSGLSIESGHVFRQQGEKLCHPVELHLGASQDEDIENGYLMGSEQYDNIKYESSLVKRLMACETVEEMYALADDIIGVLKTIDDSSRVPEDNISDTLVSAT